MYCEKCKSVITHNKLYGASYVLYCPNCLEEVDSLGEYGFGMVYPCNYFLGDRKFATLVNEGTYPNTYGLLQIGYNLEIKLDSKSYLEQLLLAKPIIEKWLKENVD